MDERMNLNKLLQDIAPALDDFSNTANTMIKNGMEKSGKEMHENIGFIKGKFMDYQAKEEASKEQYIYTCSCSAVYDPELKNCPACGEKTIDNGKYLCYICNQWGVVGNHKCEASKGGCACKSYETVEIGCEVCHPELKLDLPERKGECMHEGDRSNFHPQYCTKCGKEFMYDNPPEHEEEPWRMWKRKYLEEATRNYVLTNPDLFPPDKFVSKEKIKKEAEQYTHNDCGDDDFRKGIKYGVLDLLESLGIKP